MEKRVQFTFNKWDQTPALYYIFQGLHVKEFEGKS